MSIEKNRYIGVFVVIFVVFWFFGSFFNFNKNEKNEAVVWNELNLEYGDTEEMNAESIFFKEVSEDSYVADIEYVSMPSTGFVVVVNGNSKIIGASKLLNVGMSRNISIILTESLKSGDYYSVNLYQDNGDNRFSPKEDIIYLNPKYNVASVGGFLVK